MIIQNTSARLPVKLITSTGTNATGIVVANIKNGVVQVIKEDGTTATYALTLGVNWFEVDSTQSPGLYQVIIPSGATNVLGQLVYTIYASAAGFVDFAGTELVSLTPAVQADVAAIKAKTDNLPASPANEVTSLAIKAKTDNLPATPADQATSLLIKTKTDLLPASPANEVTVAAIKAKTDLIATTAVSSQADVNAARDSVKGAQLLDISTIAGGTTFVSGTDNLHQIRVNEGGAAGIAAAVWDEIAQNHLIAGSMGEAMNFMRAALAGNQIIDVTAAKLTFYAADGVTPVVSFWLQDENGKPSVNNVKKRIKV